MTKTYNIVDATYNKKYNDVLKQLRYVEVLLEDHNKKATGNSGANYSQVGDLNHVIESLDEITRFLS